MACQLGTEILRLPWAFGLSCVGDFGGQGLACHFTVLAKQVFTQGKPRVDFSLHEKEKVI